MQRLIYIILLIGLSISCSVVENEWDMEPQEDKETEINIHRIQDTTTHESEWYYAKSTEGNFSVLMPIPFNDFTIGAKKTATYGIGSESLEGISFTVIQMKNQKKTRIDLTEMVPKSTAKDKISDVKYYEISNYEAVEFFQESENSSAFNKYAKLNNNGYIMIIEFPIQQEELALSLKDFFFGNLKIHD